MNNSDKVKDIIDLLNRHFTNSGVQVSYKEIPNPLLFDNSAWAITLTYGVIKYGYQIEEDLFDVSTLTPFMVANQIIDKFEEYFYDKLKADLFGSKEESSDNDT